MADFTKTVSNELNVFGGGQVPKWGDCKWNEVLWGEGSIAFAFGKYIGNTATFTPVIYKGCGKYVANAVTLIDVTEQIDHTDGSGYYYIFPGEVTDATNKTTASFSQVSASSSIWTEISTATVTWS